LPYEQSLSSGAGDDFLAHTPRALTVSTACPVIYSAADTRLFWCTAATATCAREFEKVTEARRNLDDESELKALRRGWYFGGEEFRRELLEQMSGKMGRHHGGVERQETAEQEASRLLAEELTRRGWSAGELKRRKKSSDHGKAAIAQRLRRETTVTWDWIARSLLMGVSGHAANCVRSLVNGA
jgi:hypothetical protein